MNIAMKNGNKTIGSIKDLDRVIVSLDSHGRQVECLVIYQDVDGNIKIHGVEDGLTSKIYVEKISWRKIKAMKELFGEVV